MQCIEEDRKRIKQFTEVEQALCSVKFHISRKCAFLIVLSGITFLSLTPSWLRSPVNYISGRMFRLFFGIAFERRDEITLNEELRDFSLG